MIRTSTSSTWKKTNWKDVWANFKYKLKALCCTKGQGFKNFILKLLILILSVPMMVIRLLVSSLKHLFSIVISNLFVFITVQLIFVLSIYHISKVFFVEQPKVEYKYQPYIPIDGESQWYSLPVEKCHLTILIACTPKVNLFGHEYDHIIKNLDNISQFKQRLFHPCIVLFNQDIDYKDKLNHIVEEFSKRHEAVVDVVNYPGKTVSEANSKSKIFYDMVSIFKETYMLDDVNSIEESVTRVISTSDSPLMFMDESAMICLQAISHISLVFEHMQHLNEKGQDWSSYRISQGMSGTIMQRKDIVTTINYFEKRRESKHSLKHLLDNYFLDKNVAEFKERLSYRYRFQLLSLAKNQKSQCFETQSDFKVETCPTSLFSPCYESLKKPTDGEERKISDFQHNTATVPSFPPTHKFSLSDLKNVESVFCEYGENCNQCCSKLGAMCDVNFFEYLNRCDEFEKFTKNCKCAYEKGSPASSLPLMRNGNCLLGFRASNFNCHNSDASSRRLCPCVLK